VRIRVATPDDAAAIVALTAPIEVTAFHTAATFRALLEREAPASTERLVAEEDGELVAWAPSGVGDDGRGWFWVGVAHARRRRGIGGELYGRIEKRLRGLGAPVVGTWANDVDGRAFLERRGFELGNVMRMSTLDLQSADLPEPSAETVPLREVDTGSVVGLYLEGRLDIPSARPRGRLSRDEVLRELESEVVDRDVSSVLLEHGKPIALALVIADHERRRAGSDFTTVRRDRRRRGLAHAVKLASLRRARDAGLRTMLAANDLENQPMLAVNRRLGFEPTILLENFEKRL
jgi:GNAT superfamily N-acetyltransferase